ncbi:MAG: hypothetical protein QOF49_196, partial [Chloroflexota bacterium]|nr:hypothetical protein [Chloroflexota bacterium]
MTTTIAAPARRVNRLRRFLAEPRRLATMTAVAFTLTTVGLFAVPRSTFAWDANTFNAASEA